MSLLVLDKSLEKRLRRHRRITGADRHDEVWEGVYVMSPLADIEHQRVVAGLTAAFYEAIHRANLGDVYPGVNVSDRVEDWKKNYRAPDVVVTLGDSKAQNHGTHWTGAVDFIVEVVSRYDRSRRKVPFYSRIGVRELLLVERHPWCLRFYRHTGTKLELAGTAELDASTPLDSEVIPFRFELVSSDERPQIRLTHKSDGRIWLA